MPETPQTTPEPSGYGYIPQPTLPKTSPPPMPWPEPTSTDGARSMRPIPPTLNVFAQTPLPEEDRPPKALKPFEAPQPEPPDPK